MKPVLTWPKSQVKRAEFQTENHPAYGSFDRLAAVVHPWRRRRAKWSDRNFSGLRPVQYYNPALASLISPVVPISTGHRP